MAIHVDHIADVSFKNHFLEVGGNTPKNGQIEVNDNTFAVTFENGRVNARFTTGNWFTNLFRFRTMDRFKDTLQTQYNNWIQENTKAMAAQAGFKDNDNVPAVKTAVNDCFDILHSSASKLDKNTLNCSKDVLKAYATMHEVNGVLKRSQTLNEHDTEHFEHYCEVMPQNLGKYAKRLGIIADLAAIRNDLTTMPTGSEIANKLLIDYGIKTHLDQNCEGKSEEYKKRYLLDVIDTVLNVFLDATNAMKDKSTELFRFLDKFDGVCLEAKGDNVQEWFLKSSGDVKEARSTEKDNLAFSVAAEFKALAAEVEAPFRDEARKACEAEMRAACEKVGIVDEVQIEERIKERVEVEIAKKSDKITPLINKKIEEDGKFALYDNLVGANRPVTVISKNEETGMWKVTTFVDKDNKPILKPVSAFDIDKQFEKLMAMYKEDAVLMNMVELETRTAEVKMGNRNDLFATDVIDTASAIIKDDKAVAEFCKRVKNQMRVKLDIKDAEFEGAVRQALGDVIGCKALNSEDTELRFGNFIRNYADSSYADQHSDIARLTNLVARRVENLKAYYDSFLADLDDKAGHCAQMIKKAYPNKVVDVKEAQKAIATTLRTMIERVKADPNNPKNRACKSYLGKVMYNGRLFTDELRYDMSHRAAGGNEGKLHESISTLLMCIEHYGGINPGTFIHNIAQEAQA